MVVANNDKDSKDEAPGAAEKAAGTLDSLKQQSIRAAGVGYLLADAALFTSGVMAGRLKEASAGVFGWTAGFIGTRYGNPKAEKQLELLSRQLGDYLRKEGIEIPKDPSTEALTKQGGVIDGIESFLYKYPSQMMNVFYSLIGVQFARSAVQHNKKELFASGCLLIAGALAGLLIPEKKPDPEHPPEGALQKAWSWVQEKPLRLTGTLFTMNQVTLAMDALRERRENPAQKSYVFKLLAVAGFVFGNSMMALSSKSEGGGGKMDEETLGKLGEMSARVIAAQPKEVQDSLIEHISGYLASQPNIQMNAGQISSLLHQKMREITSAQAVAGWQGKLAASQAAEASQALR